MHKLYPNNEKQNNGIYNIEEEIDESLMNKNGLLNTIKVPTNLAALTKRLPKANYSLNVPHVSTEKVKKTS
jgi:hypothetical protein